MSSMNISIKDEAYQFLKSLKSNNQSFSDVILQFKDKSDITRFHGILKKLDWKTREKEMKSFRSSFDER